MHVAVAAQPAQRFALVGELHDHAVHPANSLAVAHVERAARDAKRRDPSGGNAEAIGDAAAQRFFGAGEGQGQSVEA